MPPSLDSSDILLLKQAFLDFCDKFSHLFLDAQLKSKWSQLRSMLANDKSKSVDILEFVLEIQISHKADTNQSKELGSNIKAAPRQTNNLITISGNSQQASPEGRSQAQGITLSRPTSKNNSLHSNQQNGTKLDLNIVASNLGLQSNRTKTLNDLTKNLETNQGQREERLTNSPIKSTQKIPSLHVKNMPSLSIDYGGFAKEVYGLNKPQNSNHKQTLEETIKLKDKLNEYRLAQNNPLWHKNNLPLIVEDGLNKEIQTPIKSLYSINRFTSVNDDTNKQRDKLSDYKLASNITSPVTKNITFLGPEDEYSKEIRSPIKNQYPNYLDSIGDEYNIKTKDIQIDYKSPIKFSSPHVKNLTSLDLQPSLKLQQSINRIKSVNDDLINNDYKFASDISFPVKNMSFLGLEDNYTQEQIKEPQKQQYPKYQYMSLNDEKIKHKEKQNDNKSFTNFANILSKNASSVGPDDDCIKDLLSPIKSQNSHYRQTSAQDDVIKPKDISNEPNTSSNTPLKQALNNSKLLIYGIPISSKKVDEHLIDSEKTLDIIQIPFEAAIIQKKVSTFQIKILSEVVDAYKNFRKNTMTLVCIYEKSFEIQSPIEEEPRKQHLNPKAQKELIETKFVDKNFDEYARLAEIQLTQKLPNNLKDFSIYAKRVEDLQNGNKKDKKINPRISAKEV